MAKSMRKKNEFEKSQKKLPVNNLISCPDAKMSKKVKYYI